jgi:hypothetical protein
MPTGLLIKEEEGVLLSKLGYVFPNKGEDNFRELKRSADVNPSYEEKDSDNFISVNTFGTIPRITGKLQAKTSRLQG